MIGDPLAARLAGVGFWSAGSPSPAALTLADPGADPAAAAGPAAALLPARLRRRASLVTRMCAEVYAQACAQATAGAGAPAAPRVVMSSTWGEIEITMRLLEAIARGELLSPTDFHNSVHNAALGYLSIATGNTRPGVAISAGDEGVAMGALEALCAVAQEGAPCVLLAVEEPVPEPLGHDDAPAVAMAWWLDPPHVAAEGSSRLSLRRGRGPALDALVHPGQDAIALPGWLASGRLAPLGPMAAAVVAHRRRWPLEVGLGTDWTLTLEPEP